MKQHDDKYLEKMADYYSSEYVKENMPHIRGVPFYEWLNILDMDIQTKGFDRIVEEDN